MCSVVRLLGGDTEYPVAGLPINLFIGATHFVEPQTQARSSFINPRAVMTSDDVGVRDYPEHKTPSEQYENGQITYIGRNYRPSRVIPRGRAGHTLILYDFPWISSQD